MSLHHLYGGDLDRGEGKSSEVWDGSWNECDHMVGMWMSSEIGSWGMWQKIGIRGSLK